MELYWFYMEGTSSLIPQKLFYNSINVQLLV